MIEQRLVNVHMITIRGQQADRVLVQTLKVLFERQGASGSVLLLPRKSAMDRYLAVGNVEVVLAAMAAGIETVSGLIGHWPSDVHSTIPAGLSEVRKLPDVAPAYSDPDALPPLDRARHYASQVEKYGSQKKAARALRIPRSRINNAVQLLKLHVSVQQALQEQLICESAARTISMAPTATQQQELLRWYCESQPRPPIRELEASIRTLVAQEGDATANGKLVRRFCSEFSEQHGVTLRYISTGVGGWCSLDVADQNHGAHVFSRLMQSCDLDKHRPSARKIRDGLRIRFHVQSNAELQNMLSVFQTRPQNAEERGRQENARTFFGIPE